MAAEPKPVLSRSGRALGAHITGQIAYLLGQLSAIVPRGELLDLTDRAADLVTDLAEAIGAAAARDDDQRRIEMLETLLEGYGVTAEDLARMEADDG